jgi:hypothetical protein
MQRCFIKLLVLLVVLAAPGGVWAQRADTLPGSGGEPGSDAPSNGPTLRLEPADRPLQAAPFLMARLTVDGDWPLAPRVGAVAVQEASGGPTVVMPLAVPPGQLTTVDIPLPAWSLRHQYRLVLLASPDASAKAIGGEAVIAVDWSAAAVEQTGLIQPRQYYRLGGDLPVWPGTLRWQLLLSGVLLALAMGAALFIRRRFARLAAGGAAAAVALAAVWALLAAGQLVERRELVVPAEPAPQGQATRRLVLLASRRTLRWDSDQPLLPLYASPRHILADDAIVTVGSGISLTLRPESVRLLTPPTDRSQAQSR